MRLLITGASGLLGQHLARRALELGWRVSGTFRRSPLPLALEWHPLDVSDPQAAHALLRAVRPEVVIHTAALDRGPDLWRVNVEGTRNLTQAARAVQARLVHLSSDAIFDGTASPYPEAAPPAPITPYGASKAAAEAVVQSLYPQAVIVRTSLILSRHPLDKHSRMVLEFASGVRPGALFTDEIRCPVGVEDLAAAVLELAQGSFSGILHLAGPDTLSRYALGRLVLEAEGLDPDRAPAGTLAESGLYRPADVRLDISLARKILQTHVRSARTYLQLPQASP